MAKKKKKKKVVEPGAGWDENGSRAASASGFPEPRDGRTPPPGDEPPAAEAPVTASLERVIAVSAATAERDDRPSIEALRESVGHGTLAGQVLDSIEAAITDLQRACVAVAALGESLAIARDQLAEQEAELEAVQEAHEQAGEAIRSLESEKALVRGFEDSGFRDRNR